MQRIQEKMTHIRLFCFFCFDEFYGDDIDNIEIVFYD